MFQQRDKRGQMTAVASCGACPCFRSHPHWPVDQCPLPRQPACFGFGIHWVSGPWPIGARASQVDWYWLHQFIIFRRPCLRMFVLIPSPAGCCDSEGWGKRDAARDRRLPAHRRGNLSPSLAQQFDSLALCMHIYVNAVVVCLCVHTSVCVCVVTGWAANCRPQSVTQGDGKMMACWLCVCSPGV